MIPVPLLASLDSLVLRSTVDEDRGNAKRTGVPRPLVVVAMAFVDAMLPR